MITIEDVRRKSVRGVVSYAIRTIALQVIGFVATVLLGYFLTPADFGIYFIVTSVVGLLTFLSDIGLAAALVQKKEQPTIEELRTTFTVQQMLACAIFALTIILTPLWNMQNGLHGDGLWLLYALGFSFVMASFKTIPSILLERKLEFSKLVFPQILENLTFYGIAVMLAWKGFGVMSYTYAVLARSVIGVVSIYMIQSWSIGLAFSKDALRRLLKYGMKFQLNDFLARIKDDLFIVVLARFLDPSQMGYVSWAKRWSLFPYQFSVNSIMSVTFPTFSRLQDHPEKLKRAIEKSIYFITLVIFPILVGLSVLAFPMTELIPKYAKWQPAIPSLYFFCINVAFAAISSPLVNTMNAIGKINNTLKLMMMWTVLTWTLTPVAVYMFSFTGVAVASALIAASSYATVWMVKKYVKIEAIDQIWRQGIASLLMGGVLAWGLPYWEKSFVWMGVGVAVGVGVYVAGCVVLGYKKLMFEVNSLRR